jgi:serine protease AprX
LAGDGRLSNGVIRGVAPECQIIALKVLDKEGNGRLRCILSGIDWILENHRKYRIQIVNLSVGALPEEGFDECSILLNKIGRLWDSGMVVVIAAGNEGPDKGSVTSPGIHPKVITVGSSDDAQVVSMRPKRKIHYSGRGPVPSSCVVKPEVVAPGANIVACNAQWRPHTRIKPYTIKSGTSMSTPMVSGAIALLLEVCPYLSNGQVKLCLKESCKDIGLPKNHQGWGLLQADRLVSAGLSRRH